MTMAGMAEATVMALVIAAVAGMTAAEIMTAGIAMIRDDRI